MISDEQLRAIFIESVEAAGGVTKWARLNKLLGQRPNVDNMYQGTKPITKTVAKKLGYKKVKTWVKKPK